MANQQSQLPRRIIKVANHPVAVSLDIYYPQLSSPFDCCRRRKG